MRAIIPLAGKGTRLRPHTLTIPKPLIRIGGRPVMSYILDDLKELGIEEVVFVVGYLREEVEAYISREYPGFTSHYVVQEVQDGTAGAVALAEPWADEDLLILFVDTLFEADLSLIRTLPTGWSGIIWAKEVEDYQRFGVIVTDQDGAMTRIVEKPTEPVSKLANIGLYYIRDSALLFQGIRHVLSVPPGPSGEFFLTDAFQYMVDRGAKIRTAPVGGWYDCGKVETLLETNHHLLLTTRGGIDPGATLERCEIVGPVRVEAGARLVNVALGPNVTVERGVHIRDSAIRDSIVGQGSVVRGCHLHDSIVGKESRLDGVTGRVNLGAFSELQGDHGTTPNLES
ncbi:MAG: nucleotidyl transferase [Gemmatimonadetes bacterium]|nr:nucleotidyl transferase [Gemmatimonadota bacterium]